MVIDTYFTFISWSATLPHVLDKLNIRRSLFYTRTSQILVNRFSASDKKIVREILPHLTRLYRLYNEFFPVVVAVWRLNFFLLAVIKRSPQIIWCVLPVRRIHLKIFNHSLSDMSLKKVVLNCTTPDRRELTRDLMKKFKFLKECASGNVKKKKN